MIACKWCGKPMIRADMYDPEGEFPLKVVTVDDKQWTCIKATCPDGAQNQKES
jgi:hypothetical protein